MIANIITLVLLESVIHAMLLLIPTGKPPLAHRCQWIQYRISQSAAIHSEVGRRQAFPTRTALRRSPVILAAAAAAAAAEITTRLPPMMRLLLLLQLQLQQLWL